MNDIVKAMEKFKVAEMKFARIEGQEESKITEYKIKEPVVIFAMTKETWDKLQKAK